MGLISCGRKAQPDGLEHLPSGFTAPKLSQPAVEVTQPWSELLLGLLLNATFLFLVFPFWGRHIVYLGSWKLRFSEGDSLQPKDEVGMKLQYLAP